MNEVDPPITYELGLCLIIIAIFAVLSVIYLYQSYLNLQRSRQLRSSKYSDIANASSGNINIIGEVVPDENGEIIAPYTGLPCVWYSVKSVKYDRYDRSDSGPEYRVVEENSSNKVVTLFDGTGRCLLDLNHAKLFEVQDQTWEGKSPRPVKLVNDQHGLSKIAADIREDGYTYQYEEKRIVSGDTLYVSGKYQRLDITAANGKFLNKIFTPCLVSTKNHHKLAKELQAKSIRYAIIGLIMIGCWMYFYGIMTQV